ncbi:hypothetical protein ABH930_000303 [Kitasatospora sp. GAS204A]|uniref:hypothetical protein n=1 Tax=unclassified Kitasatospora TaxID=2633591 RepID=UPI0024743946|nr:hypothetical protein [Kitasatospora sp. GAS204B]MDH6116884.1 hypothetical protein [Kitasatospora sp. GAS204B]
MLALLWAIPAMPALAVVLVLLPEQHRGTAMRAALGLWIAITCIVLPALLSRS